MKKLLTAMSLTGLLMLQWGQYSPAQEMSPQLSEAQAFFNQVIRTTDNPLIAAMAKESLSKLKTGEGERATQAETEVEIPLLTQNNNSLAVPVLLDKKVMATFIIDTGATYTVITPRIARKLGIAITKDTPRVSIITANGAIKAPMVTLKNVTIGRVEMPEVQAIVQDLGNHDVLLSGLLGMNFFKDTSLTVRNNKLILTVHQPRKAAFNY